MSLYMFLYFLSTKQKKQERIFGTESMVHSGIKHILRKVNQTNMLGSFIRLINLFKEVVKVKGLLVYLRYGRLHYAAYSRSFA